MTTSNEQPTWGVTGRLADLLRATGPESSRRNPATKDAVASVFPTSTSEDVDATVAAAAAAATDPQWRDNPAARAGALLAWAEAIEAHGDSLGAVLTSETGKTLFESGIEVGAAARMARHFAAEATRVSGTAAVMGPNVQSVVLREPVGVVAVVVPWNWPLMLTMRAVCAALAGGNVAIVKPAELATACVLDLLVLGLESGVPAGALAAVTGPGSTTGACLISHDGVDAVSFTGSTRVGQTVMRAAADKIRHVALELGGKSPHLVFADANLDKLADAVKSGAFDTTGQVCTGGHRILVEASIAEEVIDRLAAMVNAVKVGDPRGQVDVGPLVSDEQRASVLEFIELGKSTGRLLAGGQAVPEDGAFVAPHLFGDLPADSRLLHEEIFGPVITVQTFTTEDEALALANSTDYGLASAVWTTDLNRAWRIARGVQAGTVWLNTYHHFYDPIEETGWKMSGLGSVRGSGGVDAFTQRKHINFDANPTLW